MNRKLKTDAIPTNLLRDLDSHDNYMKESLEVAKKMISFIGKKPEELTNEEKTILKRSSELVILLKTTSSLEKLKQK